MRGSTERCLNKEHKGKIKQLSGKVELYNYYFPRLPRLYWIDINSTCNLSCIMCPQSKGGFKRRSVMPVDMFKAIIDEICRNRPLIKLYISGEPLLHKDLFAMIEYADNKGCQTMVHTNATLLTEEVAAGLLASKLTYLSFSFDGCSQEVYEKLRPPASYQQVKMNIQRFLELQAQNDLKGPHTSIEIIQMEETENFIEQFTACWEKSGVDAVNIRPYLTWLGTIDDRRSQKPANYGYRPCSHVFTAGSILSDGTVVPCCLDVHGKMPLGNISRESFRAIWYGDKYLHLRRQMLSGDLAQNTICQGCENTVITYRE